MPPAEVSSAGTPDSEWEAVRHSLGWLLAANCVGVWLAALLLFPRLNEGLGEWTYGRWAPLHLNLHLYGWCSLPLVGWLLRVYGVSSSGARAWSRAVVWGWSLALIFGAGSWLAGEVSGKLFLDWRGLARALFPLAVLLLWVLLAWAWLTPGPGAGTSRGGRLAGAAGLLLLLAVPWVLFLAGDPRSYPPVNHETGGPTGASLLDSTLAVVAILLVLPWGCGRPARSPGRVFGLAAGLLTAEIGLGIALGHGDATHHQPAQIGALACLLPWGFLLPACYARFDWPAPARRWLRACWFWWALLVVGSFTAFLPGVLDRIKFTNALVAHSHLAMAGFISSLNLFLLAVMSGDRGVALGRPWSFSVWQGGVLAQVLVLAAAGWREGVDPAFTFVPGGTRQLVLASRLAAGVLMTLAAVSWWRRCGRASGLARAGLAA